MPLFSVIIPTKNRPAFVDIALYSLQHQSFSDFEVIVTDDYDDDSDSCQSVVEKYQDKRFIYVHPPEQPLLGMCGNWEYGLQFASGKYIGFMQDKMYMYVDSLERLYDCLLAEKFPDMVNWGWDFFDLDRKEGSSFSGILCHIAGKNGWGRRRPEEEIEKKLLFMNGNYQFPGGIPGCGSLLAGVVRKEIIDYIVDTYGSVFNFFNPDYGPPLLLLSLVKSLFFYDAPLFVMVPLVHSEGLRHSISYEAACRFQETSPCGVSRLQYATIPCLRVTNTNMVSADYNYTMQLLGRDEKCNEKNVFQGILNDAAEVRYERYEDYARENEKVKDFCKNKDWPLTELPTGEGKRIGTVDKYGLRKWIRDVFLQVIPRKVQPPLRKIFLREKADCVQWIYYSSPKKSIYH